MANEERQEAVLDILRNLWDLDGLKRLFWEELNYERTYTANLTHGQLYVLRELRILFEATEEEEIKRNVNVLEKALRRQLNAQQGGKNESEIGSRYSAM